MYSVFDMQRGEVDVVVMGTKGSPPGAGNPEAEPRFAVNSSVVNAAVGIMFALLLKCSSVLVRWEAALAGQASSKVQ